MRELLVDNLLGSLYLHKNRSKCGWEFTLKGEDCID